MVNVMQMKLSWKGGLFEGHIQDLEKQTKIEINEKRVRFAQARLLSQLRKAQP